MCDNMCVEKDNSFETKSGKMLLDNSNSGGDQGQWTILTWLYEWSNIFGIIAMLTLLLLSSYVFRDYIHSVLRWVESQPDPVAFLILVALYILVSLPLAWGYIVINIATGYLYGIIDGILVTFVTATMGILIAHYIIKMFLLSYVERLVESSRAGSTLRSISLILSSPSDAFQLVLLSRLTPIPFGLQNSVFALGTMSTYRYIQASCLGLLPCQLINVYLGSTLRSMEEVLTDTNTATIGIIVLVCQLTFVGFVIFYIVTRARTEWNKTITIESTSLPMLERPPGGQHLVQVVVNKEPLT